MSLSGAVCFTREPFGILLAHPRLAGESAAGQQAVEGWGAEAPQLGLAAGPRTQHITQFAVSSLGTAASGPLWGLATAAPSGE